MYAFNPSKARKIGETTDWNVRGHSTRVTGAREYDGDSPELYIKAQI